LISWYTNPEAQFWGVLNCSGQTYRIEGQTPAGGGAVHPVTKNNQETATQTSKREKPNQLPDAEAAQSQVPAGESYSLGIKVGTNSSPDHKHQPKGASILEIGPRQVPSTVKEFNLDPKGKQTSYKTRGTKCLQRKDGGGNALPGNLDEHYTAVGGRSRETDATSGTECQQRDFLEAPWGG